MKYFIIAGEASGDLHASNFLKALNVQDPSADLQGWGGDMMQAVGVDIRKHYKELAFMGFVEVAKNIRTILGNFKICKADILAFEPDVVILVDYPGFNLRMAKWLKKKGIKVFYYISPQIWAWHQSRVHAIKKHVDRMFVILPFEQDFYAKYDMEVDFVGHPLLEVVEGYEPDLNWTDSLPQKPIIALLPGSRSQEIQTVLPEMLAVIDHFSDYQFVIAGAPSQTDYFYQKVMEPSKLTQNIPIVFGKTYDILAQAEAALVTSGTATLEAALFEVPQIVCYKGSPISYAIAKRLVQVKYISLVNLILDKEIVKELIQKELNTPNIAQELKIILNKKNRIKIKNNYKLLKDKLGRSGASKRLAKLVVEELTK